MRLFGDHDPKLLLPRYWLADAFKNYRFHFVCARAQREDVLNVDIERVWPVNLQVYGADKVLRQQRREETNVARCTVERLMRKAGLRGAPQQGRAHDGC